VHRGVCIGVQRCLLRQPQLAASLRCIAREGAGCF
jgi:hypothetical protein